jgi:Ca2+/H+ antiporter, TMEM165/GDT1 family
VLESLEQGGVLALLVVFVAAATPGVAILLVIPAGIAAGLPPVGVTLLALAGNVTALAVVVLAGERIRRALGRRSKDSDPGQKRSRRSERAQRLAERWGVPGLALLAPVSTGTNVAAVAMIALGASRGMALAWLTAGLAVWAVGVAVASVLGLGLLNSRAG